MFDVGRSMFDVQSALSSKLSLFEIQWPSADRQSNGIKPTYGQFNRI